MIGAPGERLTGVVYPLRKGAVVQRITQDTHGVPGKSQDADQWLMGLPAGYVTGVSGLSRTAQIYALGNGVVSQ
ncbi:hypothetical protein AB0C33_15160 [Nonomuraea sp. NPDC048881]|uniref:hypothetical protein n=1 Tax=Nonomuraea sp. NPDC048881 TaxID=3155030 RepID=UPI0033DBE21C